MPAKTSRAYGATPSVGSFASRPKTTVKTTMVRKGRSTAQATADQGLLVAHRDVAPGEDQEEVAVAPEIAPVVLFGATRLENEGDLLQRALALRRTADGEGHGHGFSNF